MKKSSKLRIAGFALCLIQFLVTAVLLIQLVVLDFLPGKYFLILAGLLMFDVLAAVLLNMLRNKGHWIGKLLSFVTIIGLGAAIFMIGSADHVIETVTRNTDVESNEVYIVVKNDSPCQTLRDTKKKKWGVQYAQEVELMGKAVDAAKSDLNCDLDLEAFDDYDALYPALMDEKIDVMVLSAAYMEIIDEQTESEEEAYVFSDEVRILKTYTFEEEITEETKTKDFDITRDPFTVFISGIDTYGTIQTKSRSDVNILMTVNPSTKQILLVTTPRDAYTILPGVSGKSKDKLTHAGIYGIKCSMDTLSYIYGVDIDYYVRVNFNSVEEIVDALGGIEVYSEYDFTVGSRHFTQGYNTMDGDSALAFARERHSFADGDFQRGRDQMAVIKGIINKAASKAILRSFQDIMKVVSENAQTNVSTDNIFKLVKMQLGDNAAWDIFSFETEATPGREYCYSYTGKSLSVSILHEDSVKQAVSAMKKLKKGKELTGADVAQ